MSQSLSHIRNVYGAWYDYVPAVFITKKAAQEAGKWYYGPLSDDQKGAVGGTATDHTGLLGQRGARVPAAALRDAQQGKSPGTSPQYRPVPDKKPDYLPVYVALGVALVGALGVAVIIGGNRR